jgi:transposase
MDQRDIIEIDRDALSSLMIRIEEAIEHDLALSVDDMKLLLSAITTLCTLQSKMEMDDVTLDKLRKLLGMVKQSERRQPSGSAVSKSKRNKQINNKRPRERNHAKAPKVVHHKIQDHHKGDRCSGCERGKLYKFDPATLLRITGHARYEATRHVVEQLRCNACQQVYKAPLPKDVIDDGDTNQKYGYSARSLMVIDKFYTGTPYYHQSNLADIFGCAISASTIFDQCEHVANAVMPVFYELQRQAANANRFLLDDTHNRILAQQPVWREKANGKGKQLRTGVYTSGLIAECANGHDIVLFDTSLGHAGEHLDAILLKRNGSLPLPLIMCDALSSNTITKAAVKYCYCNAHARRQFYDLEKLYPNDIIWLLDQYGMIWKHDAQAKDEDMNDLQRLTYHQEHSLPAMKKIHNWASKRQASEAFEEHSALGKAINYFLKHYKRLIMFCVEAGALIDNNRMEEKLKIVIRGRKTSHFYKTATGADVANVLVSLIATTDQARENVFDYLQVLQKNQQHVKASPSSWLPWAYRDSLKVLEETEQSGKKSPLDSS